MAKPANAPVAHHTVAAPKDWVQQRTGFAPYFSPKTGDAFMATPVDFDDSDPSFDGGRYLFIADDDIECARGPAASPEPVTVHKGEEFTMSGYAALGSIVDYFGMVCHIVVGDKIPLKSKPNQSVWQFKLSVSPEDNARLAQARQEGARKRIAAAKEARQLKAANASADAQN